MSFYNKICLCAEPHNPIQPPTGEVSREDFTTALRASRPLPEWMQGNLLKARRRGAQAAQIVSASRSGKNICQYREALRQMQEAQAQGWEYCVVVVNPAGAVECRTEGEIAAAFQIDPTKK